MNRAALCTYSYNDDKTKAMAERQVQLEQEYRTRGLDRSQKLIQEAIVEQRVSTLPAAQRLIAAAYDTVAAEIDKTKAEKVPGVGGRYRAFLRLAPLSPLPDVPPQTAQTGSTMQISTSSSASNS